MPVDSAPAVARIVHRTLSDTPLGIYLHGSAVLAGLRPHSDIDVLVVVRRSLNRDERRALVGELMRVSGVPGARLVDGYDSAIAGLRPDNDVLRQSGRERTRQQPSRPTGDQRR